LPTDVKDLWAKGPALIHDFTCLALLGLLKESAFTDVVFDNMPSCRTAWGTAEFLRPRLIAAARGAYKKRQYALQASQLARQGVGRFTGSRRVLTRLRICEEAGEVSSNAEPLGGEFVHLGAHRKTSFSVLEEDDGTFAQFCQDCAKAQHLWEDALKSTDVNEVVQKLRSCVLAAKVASWFHGDRCQDPESYAPAFLARKLFMMCMAYGAIGVNWHRAKLQDVLHLFPDSKEFMEELPHGWTAGEASVFLCRRPDRLPYCMMWPCLFNDVAKEHRHNVMEALRSGSYVQAAGKLLRDTDVEHHPANVAKHL